ncbi:MAG: hypothetical protein A2Z94_01925 [Gallionellales bacterium GWA2_55_18]|nr:MAG: hypothetical protein A2Z94_01925 [Gallionellales bacterium GWA2_55_18]
MSGWGCPHEADGKCQKVNNLPCDPAMKGCVLFGRFVWGDQSKNRPAGGWGSSEQPPENIDHTENGNSSTKNTKGTK